MNKIILAMLALQNIMLFDAMAQTEDTLKALSLKEVVISVNKEEETKASVAQDVLVLSKSGIQNSQALTTADLLSNFGIPVQRSQLGGGSPMLRGFEASRILLMIDGVRMNNLIYRGGHLQDIVKTDNSVLDRVEILYGPSSTVYGSDALGGVIHMYTKKPQFAFTDKANVNVNVLSRYQSASNGLTEHLDFNAGGKKIASLTSFTYSKFDDLMSGKNQNPSYSGEYGTRRYYVNYLGNGRDTLIKNKNRFLQVGSAYSQYDILQKFAYKQNEHVTHGLNVQYSGSGDVPRYDRLTDPSATTGLKSSEWYYGPQKRMLTAYDLNVASPASSFENIHFGLNYQALEESRHNRNFNSKFLNHRIENVSVIGANLDFLKKIKEKHDLRMGFDMQLNTLESTASKEDIVSGVSAKLDTRYPDGSNAMNNFALYYSHTWKVSDQLSIVDGLRAGYSMLHSTLVDTALQFHLPYTNIEQKTPVYSGSIGFIHSASDNFKMSFLVSSGYRVPNVDDMSKIFGSVPGRVIVPNINLKPEQTMNYELGSTKIFNNRTRWENSIYMTDYYNIAVLDSFTLNGKDSMMYESTNSRIYANQNKDRAYIYGFSSNIISKLDDHLTWTLGVHYVYGRIKTFAKDTPLDHVPPFAARTSFKYSAQKFSSEFFIIYNGWKRLQDYYLGGEDNEQYATPDGMPAWFTLNLRSSYQVHKSVLLQAGVDNMFDTQYRTFASGINAPGRNIIVALRGSF